MTFVAALNASHFSERRVAGAHRRTLRNQIEEPQAKAKAEAVLHSTKLASSILNELIKGGALVEEQGQLKLASTRTSRSIAINRSEKPPKVLEPTSIGSAALGAELANWSGATRQRRARRAARGQAGRKCAGRCCGRRAGSGKTFWRGVASASRSRTTCGRRATRPSRRTFTIRTLDKPLGEVSKRAWGLHNADTLTDATNREFYDKPRPVRGRAASATRRTGACGSGAVPVTACCSTTEA